MAEVDRIKRELANALERGVRKCAEDLLGEAQRLAPVEEGTLRGSGNVEVRREGNRAVAEVSFNTAYAARQHEELDWQHPKGGQAKYLEQPLRENAARYGRILTAEAARVLR